GLKAEDVVGQDHPCTVRPFTHGDRGLGPFFHLAERGADEGAVLAHVAEYRGAPDGDLALRIDGRIRKVGDGRLGDLGLHERLEERRLRPEGAKEAHFVDAGFDGDEARRCAAEAVLGVDPFGGFEDAVTDFHGREGYVGSRTNASSYLLTTVL